MSSEGWTGDVHFFLSQDSLSEDCLGDAWMPRAGMVSGAAVGGRSRWPPENNKFLLYDVAVCRAIETERCEPVCLSVCRRGVRAAYISGGGTTVAISENIQCLFSRTTEKRICTHKFNTSRDRLCRGCWCAARRGGLRACARCWLTAADMHMAAELSILAPALQGAGSARNS